MTAALVLFSTALVLFSIPLVALVTGRVVPAETAESSAQGDATPGPGADGGRATQPATREGAST
jgi:hypothetical protein